MPDASNSDDKKVANLIPRDDVVLFLRKHVKDRDARKLLLPAVRTSPLPLYPFTKGIDLSNQGIGYGELVRITVCPAPKKGSDARVTLCSGVSRRTRSGRAVVEPYDARLTTGSIPPPVFISNVDKPDGSSHESGK